MNSKQEDSIMERAAGLAKEIPPSRDLWPGVEAAIAETPAKASEKSVFAPWFAQAAAVVLLVGASSGLTYFAMKDAGSSSAPVVLSPDLVFQQTSFARYDLGPGFQDARDRLSSQLAQELKRLSPEARSEVEQNLEAIRTAILEINSALDAEPDNALLQELLLNTYREELTVMNRVGGLTQNVMTRNNGRRNDI
ncbi:MAG: hypothetical protein AAFX56_19420 [Pseudomonadota bacterium]